MTSYTKSTNFATKDTLTSGDPLKIVKGTEINTEFDNIATAVNSKSDTASPTFTGTVTASGLTASSAVATDASKALVSVTNTGTGNNVLATSPTLVTPILGAASATSVTVAAGAVGTPSITTTGDTNTGIFFPAADQVAITTGGTQRAVVDASGNVGIGTSSPEERLHIKSSVAGVYLKMADSTGTAFVGCNASALQFLTGITERAQITSTGDLLVGTTNASLTAGEGFKVFYNSGTNPYVGAVMSSSTNSQTNYHLYSTGAGAYRFYVGMAGTIFATSTAITAIASDVRLKQDIVDYDKGLEEVLALRPRYFAYKNEPDRKLSGFIAQEVETVIPEALQPTLQDPEMFTYSIDWHPLLVKAIQEQQAIITSLTDRITALEAK